MASKKYGFTLTDIAESDIDETLTYIAGELSNPDAASTFADRLERKTDDICRAPYSGSPVENEYLKTDNIRRFLVDRYVVYYTIDKASRNIVILRVVYGRRDQEEILKNI